MTPVHDRDFAGDRCHRRLCEWPLTWGERYVSEEPAFMATATQNGTRALNANLIQKIMSADEAAALIRSGDQVGMSGFTGSGYPKAVPVEVARRIAEANFRGQKFQVSVFTGASTGPELDGALAMAGGIQLRLPYQSGPETRRRINASEMDYMDIHLSHVAQFVVYGFLGKLDVALIEVTVVLDDLVTAAWFRVLRSETTKPGSIRPSA